MLDEALVIIMIMTLITIFLLIGLPVIFPDMIADNVKKHIEGSVPEENHEMFTLSDGYNR